jgi:hypothetical protein
MSGLPRELLDHVDDRKSLTAYSFAWTQWSARSRKHLFVRVKIASLQRWCARIRPGPSGLDILTRRRSDPIRSQCPVTSVSTGIAVY